MTVSRSIGPRDQAASTFSAILMRLCEATDASAAALVDQEGETVDYSGTVDPFETKIAAAELRLAVQAFEARQQGIGVSGRLRELIVRATNATYGVICLSEGYAIVMRLPRHAFQVSRRALSEATREICAEAGLERTADSDDLLDEWVRVDVNADRRSHRPIGLWGDGEWLTLEILGRCAEGSLSEREFGYRVRVPSGGELTLVREPWGRWYADNVAALRR